MLSCVNEGNQHERKPSPLLRKEGKREMNRNIPTNIP